MHVFLHGLNGVQSKQTYSTFIRQNSVFIIQLLYKDFRGFFWDFSVALTNTLDIFDYKTKSGLNSSYILYRQDVVCYAYIII